MSFQLMGLLCILLFGSIVNMTKLLFNTKGLERSNTVALKTIAVIANLGIAAIMLGSYWQIESTSVHRTYYRGILITLCGIGCFFVLLKIIRNSNKISKLTSSSKWFCFLLTGLIAGGYCAVLSFKSFPISEGWYSVYARYINNGLVPYKDFELLFMPVYTYIIALVTRVFGYDLVVLRMFGICIFVAMALLAYKMFNLVFNEWVSVISAIVSVIYVQSEAPQIFYDYIRVFDMFTYASTYCLLSYAKRHFSEKCSSGRRNATLRIILCGLFAALAFMTRQNSGAFVIAFEILFLCIVLCIEKFNGDSVKKLIVYIVSAALPIAALFGYMYISGTLDSFIRLTFSSALDAKGGLLTVLFNWIPRAASNILGHSAFSIFLAGILLCGYVSYMKQEYQIEPDWNANAAVGITFIFMTIGSMAFAYINLGTTVAFVQLKVSTLSDTFYLMAVLVFIIEFMYLVFKMQESQGRTWHMILLALSGMIVAIGYGCGTSGGLAEGQTGLALGLAIGLVFHFANAYKKQSLRAVALTMAFCITMSAVSYKYTTAYSWWGLTEGDLRKATEQIDVDYMDGIHVSKETKYGIESIVSAIQDHSAEGDSIFAFPQVPIFYLLSNRYPDTFTLVQWFDVANDEDVVKDIDVLRENPPQVILHVHVDEGIIGSHESMFRGEGESSGLRLMDEALTEMEETYGYILAASFTLQNYPVEVWYLSDEGADLNPLSEKSGETISSFPVVFEIGDMKPVSGFGYSREKYILFPGAILGGPSIFLEPKSYEVTVIGENLDCLRPDIFSIQQGLIDDLEVRYFSNGDSTMSFSFSLTEKCEDLEIRMLNWSQECAVIESIWLNCAE